MAATATLSSTTVANAVGVADTTVTLASTAGLVPGMRIYVDRELMAVDAVLSPTHLRVRRGVDSTSTSSHWANAVVTLGNSDQFYIQDPIGVPPTPVLVSPWINVVNGTVWVARGDETGPNQAQWWEQVGTTRGIGPLGVRTVSSTP